MLKRKKQDDNALKEKKAGKIGPYLKGIPSAIIRGMKDMVPEPRYECVGGRCCCCGSPDHAANACPKNPCPGFYDKKQRAPKKPRGRKGKTEEATTPETQIAA